MRLRVQPKEKKRFLTTYKRIVTTILEKRVEKKYLVNDNLLNLLKPNDEQILVLLQNLSLQYKNIVIATNLSSISAITRKIFIPYQDLEKNIDVIKEAGKYSVLLDITEIAVANNFETPGIYIDRIARKKGEFIHPHVSSSGRPCWGISSRRELMKNLIKNAQLLDLLICIHDFLNKVNFETCYPSSKSEFLMLKEKTVRKGKNKHAPLNAN